MKTKLTSLFLAVLMLVGSVSLLASCNNRGNTALKAPEGTYTRMTVDINPSVEFMLDDQNKVVSVTALNDDGSILIAGEAFVGKTAEEAAELFVSLANDTGYLVGGNATAEENTVTVSVSGDTDYAKQLLKQTEEKISDFMEKHDIKGKVEQAEAMKLEALRELARSTKLFTEEEVVAMTENELYKALAAGRAETALLLTEDMRDAYYAAKEHKISYTEREATAKVMEGLGGLYSAFHTAYKTALSAYSQAITNLENMRYELLADPESAYQKSLAELRGAKEALLKEKNRIAAMDPESEEYASAQAALTAKEEAYNAKLSAYEQLGADATAAMDTLITLLRECENALIELENRFQDDETFKAALNENAAELETALNNAKDTFFAEFEAAHADDITAMKDALIAQKQKMILEANGD